MEDKKTILRRQAAVGDAEAQRALDAMEARSITTGSDIRIIVCQRGWVLVGRFSRFGDDVRVSDSAVIGNWGTTKGLGQLKAGPLSETIIYPNGEAEMAWLAVVFTTKVDFDAWDPVLSKLNRKQQR